MKRTTKNVLRAMASHLGLKVVFVHYFNSDVHGKLLVNERRILINAHKPRYEHVFTMLHEIAHFVLHIQKRAQYRFHRWLLRRNWKNDYLANFASKVRRYIRYVFNRQLGKEWEADLWAMIAFILLAKMVGSQNDLLTFVNSHPEKTGLFITASLACVYARIKRIAAKPIHFFQRLSQCVKVS